MTQLANRSRRLFFALFALLLLALTACGGASTHAWLEAPGWSRARLLGETQTEFPVPPAMDAAGNTYFLLVTGGADEPYGLKLLKLDASADVIWEQDYAVNAEEVVEYPRALLTGDGLQLLWIESDVLYSLKVSTDGEQSGEVEILSDEHLASLYEAVLAPSGELTVVYSGLRAHPGLYLLTESGEQVVDAGGYNPHMQYDVQGGLHLAWLHGDTGQVERQVYYAYAPNGNFEPGMESLIYGIRLPVTSTLASFGMGLDGTQTYIFWSELTRTGLGAGSVDAKYFTFPHGQPGSEISERALRFPNGYHLVYTESDGELQAGPRAEFDNQDVYPFSGLTDLAANTTSAGELAIAFRSRLPYLRNKDAQQVGVAFLKDGEQTGGQLLSFNSTPSERPAVISDANGYVYESYLGGGGNPPFTVYYAGTSPQIVTALQALDQQDYGQLATDTGFGLLSGMLLIPFILGFGFVPTLFLFFTGSFRREGEWITARGTAITLAISIVLYWFSKLAILPDMVDYIPFSAWIPDIPAAVALALRIAVPLLATALGLFVAYRSTYARERMQPLFFLLIFILVDGFITIAIYGVIFYSAF